MTLTCGLGPIQIGPGSTCPVADDLNDVRVCKVNQLGAPLSATFALVGPSGTIELVTNSSTAPTPTQDGPPPGLDPAVPDAGPGTCATSQTCASVLTAGLGDGSPGALGIADLTPGTYSLQEITAPAGSIQIQIMNGLGQIIPPGVPISVTIPCASLAVCTFLFTNSQPLAATATPSGTATATPTPIVTATPITPVPFLLFVQPPPRLGGIGAILTGPTGLPTPAPAAAVALVPAARAIVPPSTGDAGLASECTD